MAKATMKPKVKETARQKAKPQQPNTAEAIYNRLVKPLSLPERFKLAQLILREIPHHAVMDYSEEWTEEDMREFSAWSWRYILERVEREEKGG